MWQRVVVLMAVAVCSGCANYKAVSAFGGETTTMTTVVRGEFEQIETLCMRQAELAIVTTNAANDEAIEQCRLAKQAQGQYAKYTIDVLDAYAEGLQALADDKAFDVSPDLKTVGGKVKALRDSAGNPLVTAKEATALTEVAGVIVNVFAAGKRADGVKQMVAATPDLMVVGTSLRSYFARPAGATPNAPKAPYANFIGVISASAGGSQAILDSGPMRRAEPIRTAELSRELRARQKLLARRNPDNPRSVPAQVVAAIDAWLGALQRFSVDALKPDSRELVELLKDLRTATRAARDAIAEK